MSTKQEFCVNSVLAKVLQDYVQQPDHSTVRDEVETYLDGFVVLKQRLEKIDGKPWPTRWSKILFTTTESAIVEHVEMTWNKTRFTVKKINYEDWGDWFVSFISREHDAYQTVSNCWEEGARMYGAGV
jgi:hypothetical protein